MRRKNQFCPRSIPFPRPHPLLTPTQETALQTTRPCKSILGPCLGLSHSARGRRLG